MLIFNDLPAAFPWYDRLEKQNRYKEHATGICDYKLISPRDSLLPFEFRREAVLSVPTKWEIFEINTDQLAADVTVSLNKLKYKTLEGYDYFYFDGSELTATLPGGTAELNLPFGFFYGKISFSTGGAYFSEMFHIPANSFENEENDMQYLKLEWYNTTDLKPFYFSDIVGGKSYFKNVVYLESFVNASEPQISEEGTKDGDGEIVPMFQKASIQYHVSAMVPDFLKVALVLMQLHDTVILTEPGGIRSGQIKNITSNTGLEQGGFLSVVDLLFTQDLLIINKSCNTALEVDAVAGPPVLMSAVHGTGVVRFLGTAALNAWVNVWSAPTSGGTYTKVAIMKSPELLVAGTMEIPTTPGPWFKLQSENLNGIYAFSNEILST